jgi:cell division protein FtsB
LSDAQGAYQGVLEGMNKTMTSRVADLERTVEKLAARNEALEGKVDDLEGQVRDLTRENLDLARRLLQAGVKA